MGWGNAAAVSFSNQGAGWDLDAVPPPAPAVARAPIGGSFVLSLSSVEIVPSRPVIGGRIAKRGHYVWYCDLPAKSIEAGGVSFRQTPLHGKELAPGHFLRAWDEAEGSEAEVIESEALADRLAAWRNECARLPCPPRLPGTLDQSLHFGIKARAERARGYGLPLASVTFSIPGYSPAEVAAIVADVYASGHTGGAKGFELVRQAKAAADAKEAARAASEAAKVALMGPVTKTVLCLVRQPDARLEILSTAAELFASFHQMPLVVPLDTCGLPVQAMQVSPGITLEIRSVTLAANQWASATRQIPREWISDIVSLRAVDQSDLTGEDRPGLESDIGRYRLELARRKFDELYTLSGSVDARAAFIADLPRGTGCNLAAYTDLLATLRPVGVGVADVVAAARGDGRARWRKDELVPADAPAPEDFPPPPASDPFYESLAALVAGLDEVRSERIEKALQRDGVIDGALSATDRAKVSAYLTSQGFEQDRVSRAGTRLRIWRRVAAM